MSDGTSRPDMAWTGVRRVVSPAAIEAELAAVWQRSGAETPGAGVTRAAVANLVLVAGDPAQTAATVAALAATIPCRAIVVETAPGEAPPLDAWIATHCTPAPVGARQICCEQITVRVGPGGRPLLASFLLGLFLPDLPMWLVLPSARAMESSWFAALGDAVDRLVVGADATEGADALQTVAAWHLAHRRADVVHLEWNRLDLWREALAVLTDAPPFVPALWRARRLLLAHGPGGRTGALLYAGWIASRLGWRPRSRRPAGVRCQDAQGETVDLEFAASATGPAGLAQVRLETDDGIAFCVAPDATHADLLEARALCDVACPLPQRLRLRPASSTEALVSSLARRRHSPAFDAALQAAAALAAAPA